MANSTETDGYYDEDANGVMLLMGAESDGRTYISVDDRDPIVLSPEQAERAARYLLSRVTASNGLA